MSDDYLWDGDGEPDETVERLERLLARHRFDPDGPAGAPPALPAAPGLLDRRVTQRILPRILVAAALLVAVLLLIREGPAYEVRGLPGVEHVGVGDTLRTEPGERAELVIAELGSVTLEPGTRLRVRRIAEHRHALALDEGELHARILAPARVFQVDTPAGEAVDLGCAYRLRVAPDGSSELSVLEGRVAFEYDGRSVFVPAGASCASVPGRGPDAPRFRDAPRKLVALLERLEFEPDPEPAAVRALVELVERREDALTLFHLLDARSPLLRKAALDRIAQLTRLPEGTTPEGLLGGDAGMRLQLREVLEPWWRTESGYWER